MVQEIITTATTAQPANNARLPVQPITGPPAMGVIERVITAGDLAKLSPEDRVRYYGEVCHSLGLNPLTQPFAYTTLNGKLTLYCLKGGTDQLRKINNVVVEVLDRSIADNIITVHVRASLRLPDGSVRTDEDFGCVGCAGLGHDNLANAMMKAITKAKRRVTLSLLGLGMLDESEVEGVSDARLAPQAATIQPAKPQPQQIEARPAASVPAKATNPAPNMPNASATSPVPVAALMTREVRIEGFKRLKASLQMGGDEWLAALAPYGVDTVKKLNDADLKKFFEHLQHEESKRDLERQAKGLGGNATPVVIDVPMTKPKEVAPPKGAGAFPGETAA